MKMKISSSSPAGRLLGAFYATVFVAAAALFHSKVDPLVIEGISSNSWPTVPGQVIASEVTSTKDSEGKVMHAAGVRYRYQVEGQTYESGRISSGWQASSLRSQAKERVWRYPEGKEVRVHYNPARPSEALLEPGIGSGSAFAFCILMAVSVVSLLLIVSVISTALGKERPLGELVRGSEISFIRLTGVHDALALTCWTAAFAMGGVAAALGAPAVIFEWPGWVPLFGLGMVVCVMPFVAWRYYRAQQQHAHDLRVDFENQWVLLPRLAAMHEPIPFSGIVGVSTTTTPDHPESLDLQLEYKMPGEDYADSKRLTLLVKEEARQIAARVSSSLEQLMPRSDLSR